ncbi:pili assembly chaperone, partial [Klebsiella pneumoniae]|nr:pili assembly chaperone [Klebsiella pneumoniae]
MIQKSMAMNGTAAFTLSDNLRNMVSN